jgi:hypothetical protein
MTRRAIRMALCALALGAGCYDPPFASGKTQCGGADGRQCPPGLSCNVCGLCVSALPPTNLLPNPGFETDLSGWFGFFMATSLVARSTSQPHGGVSCAEVTPLGGLSYIGLDASGLSLEPGEPYLATWWMRVPTAGIYKAFTSTGMGLDWGSGRDTPVDLAADTWTQFQSTITPQTWASGQVFVYRLDKVSGAYAATELIYFDDLTLVRVADVNCGG